MKTFALAAVAFLAIASPAIAAPPPNDNFADAMKVGVGQEYTGSLLEATAELGEPDHGGVRATHSIWFRYRARSTGRVTVDTTHVVDDFLTVINATSVYTGNDLASLHEVGHDGSDIAIRFKARRGRTYRIAVDSYSPTGSAQNTYALWISDGGIKGKGVAMTVDPGQTVASVRAHGLRLHVTARRKVGMAIALRVNRATARRLGLHSRVLGRTRGTIDYGQAVGATIQLRRPARKALRDVDNLKAKVRLTLPRTTAPDKSMTVRVAL
jgi:hypothetical protein